MKILIAPLDWGMGHCSRCIPLINYCIAKGAEVSLAVTPEQRSFFEQEGVAVRYLPLKGYDISYPKEKGSMAWSILKQLPKIISSIKKEHLWLQQLTHSEDFDLVISDNRFGFWHPKIKSVYITHQLNIQAPFLSTIINKWHHAHIKKFSQCWVPDRMNRESLAGALSIPTTQNSAIKYIGHLSRWAGEEAQIPDNKKILLIASGVEPQRTLLAQKIVDECLKYQLELSIAGIKSPTHISGIQYYGHCNSKELLRLIQAHQFIISRAGYSTIMDLKALGRTALLIPTPGQTEQEYLAQFLAQQNEFIFQSQNRLDIPGALQALQQLSPSIPRTFNHYKVALDEVFGAK